MIKKILELLTEKMEIEQKLNSWNFDKNTVFDRFNLLRKKWEIMKELNLYTPEEIFTAVNYKALKINMEKRQLRKILMIENFEREEEEEQKIINSKCENMSIEKIYIIFLMMFQNSLSTFSFLEIGATITQNLKDDYDKKNTKLPIQKKK